MIYSAGSQIARQRSQGVQPAALGAMTSIGAPPLCPELRVPTLPQDVDLDSFRSTHESLLGAGVPYWAVVWPGGQALARYLLDHSEVVRGRCVVDLGCGSGIVAVAAMRAGAARAIAVDSDPNALSATAETARLNYAEVTLLQEDLERYRPESGAIICAGDLWYEREIGRRATSALRSLARRGHRVLCGDPCRPGRPRLGTLEKARYTVAVSEEFERLNPVDCRVFELST